MKKLFLMLAVAALSAQTMSAQTVEESKNLVFVSAVGLLRL